MSQFSAEEGYISERSDERVYNEDYYVCKICYAYIPDNYRTDWPGVPTTGPVHTHYTELHTQWHQRMGQSWVSE